MTTPVRRRRACGLAKRDLRSLIARQFRQSFASVTQTSGTSLLLASETCGRSGTAAFTTRRIGRC
jgi:hypothetical protein